MANFAEFLGVLLPSILGGALLFIIFCYLRTRIQLVYSPKLKFQYWKSRHQQCVNSSGSEAADISDQINYTSSPPSYDTKILDINSTNPKHSNSNKNLTPESSHPVTAPLSPPTLDKIPLLRNTQFTQFYRLYFITEREILSLVGLDALMMIKLIKTLMLISLIVTFYGFIVLLPVYGTAGGSIATDPSIKTNDFLDSISFSHISNDDSSRLQAPFFGVYFVSIVTLYFMQKMYFEMLRLTSEHKSQYFPHNYTVIARRLPYHLQSKVTLRKYFLEQFSFCDIRSLVIAQDVSKLQEELDNRRQLCKKIKIIKLKNEKRNKRITVRKIPQYKSLCNVHSEKVDAFDFYKEKLEEAEQNIQTLIDDKKRPTTPTAFVTFNSISNANIIAKDRAHQKGFLQTFDITRATYIEMAPQPCDIKQENLTILPEFERLGTLLSHVAMVLLVFFQSVPVTFFSSLTNLENIGKVLPFLNSLADSSNSLKAFLQGFLPTISLKIFMAILPYLIIFIHKLRLTPTHSQLACVVFRRLFFCLVFMVFWVYTISDTFFRQIEQFINNASEIQRTLATTLPQQANFFIGYVSLNAFLLVPLEFFQPIQLIVQLFSGVLRSDYSIIQDMEYEIFLPQILLVFLITIAFSIISPFILLFGLIYFAFSLFLQKHQLIYVYKKRWEGGGSQFPLIFNRVAIAVVIFQLITMACILLKKGFIQFGLLFPLLILSCIFVWRIDSRFAQNFTSLDLVLAKKVDDETHEFSLKNIDDIKNIEESKLSKQSVVLSKEKELQKSGSLSLSNYSSNNAYSISSKKRSSTFAFDAYLTPALRDGFVKDTRRRRTQHLLYNEHSNNNALTVVTVKECDVKDRNSSIPDIQLSPGSIMVPSTDIVLDTSADEKESVLRSKPSLTSRPLFDKSDEFDIEHSECDGEDVGVAQQKSLPDLDIDANYK